MGLFQKTEKGISSAPGTMQTVPFSIIGELSSPIGRRIDSSFGTATQYGWVAHSIRLRVSNGTVDTFS